MKHIQFGKRETLRQFLPPPLPPPYTHTHTQRAPINIENAEQACLSKKLPYRFFFYPDIQKMSVLLGTRKSVH